MVLNSDIWAVLGDIFSLVLGFNEFIVVRLVTTFRASFRGGARDAGRDTISRAAQFLIAFQGLCSKLCP